MPRWVDAKRVTFKYGLGDEFIERPARPCTSSAWTPPSRCGGGRQGLAARRRGRLPARPGHAGRPDDRQDLRRHLGHGHGQGRPAARGVPLPRGRQRVVHARVRRPGVVWQTAVNPVVALELLATGVWQGAGVLGPEAFDAVPFLDLLRPPRPGGYGSAWGMEDR